MVRYRRNFVPGGTYFFTVTLADRTSSAMVHHLGAVRMAFRIARQERPFTIEAMVILPEHLHAIWTLPSGDSDFSGRWRRIKAYFTPACCRRRAAQAPSQWRIRTLATALLGARDSERD
jgi:putative transposase